jgi:hypothetical protein
LHKKWKTIEFFSCLHYFSSHVNSILFCTLATKYVKIITLFIHPTRQKQYQHSIASTQHRTNTASHTFYRTIILFASIAYFYNNAVTLC